VRTGSLVALGQREGGLLEGGARAEVAQGLAAAGEGRRLLADEPGAVAAFSRPALAARACDPGRRGPGPLVRPPSSTMSAHPLPCLGEVRLARRLHLGHRDEGRALRQREALLRGLARLQLEDLRHQGGGGEDGRGLAPGEGLAPLHDETLLRRRLLERPAPAERVGQGLRLLLAEVAHLAVGDGRADALLHLGERLHGRLAREASRMTW
jgi:hypothetical protein